MSQKQILIDGVLYDLTPAQQKDALSSGEDGLQYKAAQPAAAEPKGKEWEILNYDFIKYPETKTVDMKDPRAIHSVRRLSDNEEFSVGETVIVKPSGDYKKTIKAFAVYGNDMRVYLDGWDDSTALYCLTKAAPARTPLFTTTDGKPVYEGDEYWFVWRTKYGNNLYDYAKNKAVKNSDSGASKEDKYFSTQAAAEQWIAENKPLYSLNDLLAALPDEASKEGIAAILRAKKK